MAGNSKDLTHLIERLEAFEKRLGVSLEGLLAEARDQFRRGIIVVNGELHPHEGTELDEDVNIIATLYDSAGRVLETRSKTVSSKSFFGFQVFSMDLYESDTSRVAKVRVYPTTKSDR